MSVRGTQTAWNAVTYMIQEFWLDLSKKVEEEESLVVNCRVVGCE
jgi:hypothetical protein